MPEMSPHFGMKLSVTIEKRHFFKIKNSEVWILNKKIFTFAGYFCGNSSVGRALASQAEGREFESRLPLIENQSLTGFACKRFFRLVELWSSKSP